MWKVMIVFLMLFSVCFGQDDIGPICYPPPDYISLPIRVSTLDADGEKEGKVFRVPKSGTISKVGWRTATVAQNTNALTVGIYTVDASGDPCSTSAYGSMVACSQAVDAGDDNTPDGKRAGCG